MSLPEEVHGGVDGRRGRITTPARLYSSAVIGAAVAFAVPLVARIPGDGISAADWLTFTLLAVAMAVVRTLVVFSPVERPTHATAMFLVAGVLLLPVELVPLLPLLQYAPGWISRVPPRTQLFDAASDTLAALAAFGAAHAVIDGEFVGTGAWAAAFGAAAAVVFVAVNRLLLAPAIRAMRGVSLRESGLFGYVSISTDLAVAALGVGLATLVAISPWLAPFALAPLVLIHRSLALPALEAEARVDGKTGLYNARHFAEALDDELERAKRFGRPVAVIMADLDLLRVVNNTYGHLAGDTVLAGIADVFRRTLRAYDVPARFGGEEFAIVLPETDRPTALRIAEQIRATVAATEFDVRSADRPIHATVSMGVAVFPRDGLEANDLVHQADVASYRAKLRGRNRVVDASEPELEGYIGLEDVPPLLGGPRTLTGIGEGPAAAIASISAKVEARDAITPGHAQRVRAVAIAVGRRLGLAPAQLETLGHAALFHDIGKVAVPESVLTKGGELTEEDWAQLQLHAEEGAAIIGRCGFLDEAVPAIRHHHERFDGSGYPDRLAREQIPLAARILHLSEAFDVMRSASLHRSGRTLDAVLEEICALSGTQFCPRCVDALVAIAESEECTGLPDPVVAGS